MIKVINFKYYINFPIDLRIFLMIEREINPITGIYPNVIFSIITSLVVIKKSPVIQVYGQGEGPGLDDLLGPGLGRRTQAPG